MLTKNPLVAICVVAFLVGGAAAVVLTRPASDKAAIHELDSRDVDAGRVVPADTSEPTRDELEGAREEATVSGESEPAPERGAVSPEAMPAGVEEVEATRSHRGTRSRAVAGRTDESSRAARGYVRVSAGRTASGGNPVVAYPVNGVKRTGQGVKKAGTAVGRTFGKVGGLFHD